MKTATNHTKTITARNWREVTIHKTGTNFGHYGRVTFCGRVEHTTGAYADATAAERAALEWANRQV